MPKEDRSSWVAVAPEFASDTAGDGAPKIKPAQSAYTFFQKAMTEQVKAEHIAANGGKFEVGLFSRAMRDKWNALDAEGRKPFEDLAVKDQYRFRSESHAADVAALERRERLQRERETLLLDVEGGTKRSTRGQRAKKERKQKRKEKKKRKETTKKKKKKHTFGDEDDDDDDEDFVEDGKKRVKDDNDMSVDEEEDESSDDFSVQSDEDSSDSDSSDSEGGPKKKKAKPAPRALSQKQIERRQKLKEEKEKKEAIVAEQQEDIRKDRAAQAQKRLEYLLQQSDIFSHFGAVKQDRAKLGIKGVEKKTSAEQGLNRRESGGDNEEVELEEADEHHATRLTAQPTTLGFGKMRDYQLEGLNWMIRLQENGVNGILADEVCAASSVMSCSFCEID
jgi:HMG-box domain/DNA-binding domain